MRWTFWLTAIPLDAAVEELCLSCLSRKSAACRYSARFASCLASSACETRRSLKSAALSMSSCFERGSFCPLSSKPSSRLSRCSMSSRIRDSCRVASSLSNPATSVFVASNFRRLTVALPSAEVSCRTECSSLTKSFKAGPASECAMAPPRSCNMLSSLVAIVSNCSWRCLAWTAGCGWELFNFAGRKKLAAHGWPSTRAKPIARLPSTARNFICEGGGTCGRRAGAPSNPT
mmetsp:Transcript_154372/g.296380  ORF Transcript_154372/g.296380 Transcript_154372/m.296380 type:complete len:232 (+) Transcript_154372:526-1221(+)